MGSTQCKPIQRQKVVPNPKNGGAVVSKPNGVKPKPIVKKQLEIKAMGSFYGSYAPLTHSPKRS